MFHSSFGNELISKPGEGLSVAAPRLKQLVEKPRGARLSFLHLKRTSLRHLVVPGAALAMIATSAVAAAWPEAHQGEASAIQTQAAGAAWSKQSVLDIRDQAVSRSCLLYTSPSPRDGLLSRMPS